MGGSTTLRQGYCPPAEADPVHLTVLHERRTLVPMKRLFALVVLVSACVGFFVTPASGLDTGTWYSCRFDPRDGGRTTCSVSSTTFLRYEVVCGHVPYSNADSPFMLLRVEVYELSNATVVYAGNATTGDPLVPGDPVYGDLYTAVKPNAHVVSIDGPYVREFYDWLFGWTVIGGPC
jgi:hypothetical protein